MPHVDEGTLHAYLDGELPPADRKTVETHLAECTSCRATLAEARALLERASALLGSVRPAVRPAPPFDQLRPRASQRARWHIRTPVAWAASIVLAVALGYYLREPGTAGVPGAPAAAQLQERRDVAANDFHESDRSAQPVKENKPSRALVRPSAPPVPAVVGAAAQAQRLAAAPDSAVATERAARAPEPSRADSSAAGVVVVDGAVARSQAATPSHYAAPAPTVTAKASDSLSPRYMTPRVASREVEELRGRTTTTSWPVISRGAAQSLLGTDPVGLPGLARKIRKSPAADGTVVVEQQIDSATTIQIFQRQTAAALEDSSLKLERQRTYQEGYAPADRLARYVGKLRVEIAGPLSVDSLNRLLDQVQPLP